LYHCLKKYNLGIYLIVYMTTRKTIKRRKTIRRRRKNSNKVNRGTNALIVGTFLKVLNMVKLYHWKTRSYSQHKATDELYERLNENIDKFVEILLGKDETRINMIEKRVDLIDENNTRDLKERIYEFRLFLTELNVVFDSKKDSDLLNVRDEILGDINQFLYLLTFDKV